MNDETKRVAEPADYAKWGAELGFAVARGVRQIRSEAAAGGIGCDLIVAKTLSKVRKNVAEFQATELSQGVSRDVVVLYADAFELVLRESTNAAAIGAAPRPIRIKTMSGSILVQDGVI